MVNTAYLSSFHNEFSELIYMDDICLSIGNYEKILLDCRFVCVEEYEKSLDQLSEGKGHLVYLKHLEKMRHRSGNSDPGATESPPDRGDVDPCPICSVQDDSQTLAFFRYEETTLEF